jgi:hypothetical protein
MGWIQYVVVPIIIILGVVILILTIRSKSKKKYLVTANKPIIINYFRTQFTDSYATGRETRRHKNPNGTHTIYFLPNDYEEREDLPTPPEQSFVVLNEYLNKGNNAEGEISSRRAMIIPTTRNPLLIPAKMRETLLGDFHSKEGQMAFVERALGKMIPSGDEAVLEIMKKYARGHLDKTFLKQVEEKQKILSKQTDFQPQNTSKE